MLAPVSVVVPAPSFVTLPDPLIAPPKAEASLRLKISAALFTTLPARLPAVPPAPTCRVPALTVVPPLYEFVPVKMVVPLPACVTAPVPLAAAKPPSLAFPLACEPGRTCAIQSYMDHDAGPGAKDYTFTVYALSAKPTLPAQASLVTGTALMDAIASLTLAQSALTVTYTRP